MCWIRVSDKSYEPPPNNPARTLRQSVVPPGFANGPAAPLARGAGRCYRGAVRCVTGRARVTPVCRNGRVREYLDKPDVYPPLIRNHAGGVEEVAI